ncbi:hypothetical protein XELAEV_18004150mg [Xenopus laevis]|uniref:G-protein coupled receptors family 1 profile domain-containing protein n=1 Tax=Xenopus laevis TaxID=8355 RepID=A0A974BRR1_XENLA|nr:hypothetical protein XELAEV_18004150mg [Xenopus laevis]
MENNTPSLSTAATGTEEDFFRLFFLLRTITVTLYSIISIIGTVGNGLVIWIIGFKMEKTATLIWFLNLGIADFSFCLFLPLYIIQIAHPYYWPFGWITCKTWVFCLQLNLSASVLFLMIISVDRCICVLYPMWAKIHRTSRLASIISVIIWIISVALSSPNIVFYEYGEFGNLSSSCFPAAEIWNEIAKAIVVTRFISTFLIPFSIILVCYGLIAFRVKTSRIPGSNIYIGFPTQIILYHLAECLAFFNSCLNPLIYVFIGRDFQQNFKKSIPFLLESTFKESNDPPEMLNSNISEMEKIA